VKTDTVKLDDGIVKVRPEPFISSDEDSFKTDKVGKDPTPLPLKELDSKEFVLLRFGQFVVDSLCVALRETPLKIEISASIPAKNKPHLFTENAYRNSFHYDSARRYIFVRRQRVQSVGPFITLLTHVVAHIKSNEWADTHPRFLEQLFAAMQHLCAELFFSRTLPASGISIGSSSAISPAGNRTALIKPGSGTGSLDQLKKTFDSASSATTNVTSTKIYNEAIENFIDLNQAGSKHERQFASDMLFSRLSTYSSFNSSKELQRFLLNLEAELDSQLENRGLPILDGDQPGSVARAVQEEVQSRNEAERFEYAALQNYSDQIEEQLFAVVESMMKISSSVAKTPEALRSVQQIDLDNSKLRALQRERDSLTSRLIDVEDRLRKNAESRL